MSEHVCAIAALLILTGCGSNKEARENAYRECVEAGHNPTECVDAAYRLYPEEGKKP